MRKFLLILTMAMGFSSAAFAQDFGLTAGVLESNASTKVGGPNGLSSGDTTSGEFGFRVGGVMSVPLTDQFLFRSGLIFSQRHFDVKVAALNNQKATMDFDYIDIPLLAQFNFVENFGVFGGLIAAANVNKNTSSSIGFDATGTKTLYPLLQVGVNATFQNMFGIEGYYEYGIGDICDQAKNFQVFGANFIYWL